MKVTRVKYGMTRITKQYENDRLGVEVELEGGDTIESATNAAKKMCLLGLGKISTKDIKEARALVALMDGE